VKNDYGTNKEACALNVLEEPVKEISLSTYV
jgi:hypothetical protein